MKAANAGKYLAFTETKTKNGGTFTAVASERSMVSKFIVDSISYWAKEYNLDSFRFDLMGLMDIDTASRNDVQAGQEFLRSKNGDENSYKSSDAVNSIKWSTKATNLTTYKYFQGLIALRRAHPAFRMTTEGQVIKSLKFYAEPNNVLMYSLAGKAVGDKVSSFVVIHNPNTNAQMIKLPKAGKWSIVVAGDKAGTSVIKAGNMSQVSVEAQSTMVLEQ